MFPTGLTMAAVPAPNISISRPSAWADITCNEKRKQLTKKKTNQIASNVHILQRRNSIRAEREKLKRVTVTFTPNSRLNKQTQSNCIPSFLIRIL
jgi:hypothetical protein